MEINEKVIAQKLAELDARLKELDQEAGRLRQERKTWEDVRRLVTREEASLPMVDRCRTPKDFFAPWMSRQHLTQADLAALMDISPSALGRWLAGESVPQARSRNRLVNAVCQYDNSLDVSGVKAMVDSWWGGLRSELDLLRRHGRL